MTNRLRQLLAAQLRRQRTRPFLLGNPIDVTLPQAPKFIPDYSRQLLLPTPERAEHCAVLGVSGSGKSRFLAADAIHDFDCLRGRTDIDTAGDYVQHIMAHIARRYYETGDESILHRTHYLRPSYDSCFNLQLFHFDPAEIPPEHREMAFEAWRTTVCDKAMRMAMRSNTQAEKEIMLRLKKWLKNVLTYLATPTPDGQLSFADAFVVLDLFHPRNGEVREKLKDRMPSRVKRDFERLKQLADKRPQDIDHYLESTDNRLTEFLSPFVESVFSRSDLPSFDYEQILSERHIVLVDLHETKYASAESYSTVADVLINQLRDTAAEREERGLRTPHKLVIDEIGAHVQEDLGKFLETMRKFGVSIWLSGQTLSTFRKGDDVDITAEILSHCRRVTSFQQKNLEDVEKLGKFFAYPERDLSERMQVMDRPDPSLDEIIHLIDESQSRTRLRAVNRAVASSAANATAISATGAENRGVVIVEADAEGEQVSSNFSEGESDVDSHHSGRSIGDTTGVTPVMMDGQLVHIPTAAQQWGIQSGDGRTRGRFSSFGGARGRNRQRSTALANSLAQLFGWGMTEQRMRGAAVTEGSVDALGEGFSRTVKQTLVQRTREEWHPTGQPRFALPFQDAFFEYLLTTLPDQTAMLRTKIEGVERTIVFRVKNVPDVFSDPQRERQIVLTFIKRLQATKNYIFVPEAPESARKKRLAKFLGDRTDENATRPSHDDDSFR